MNILDCTIRDGSYATNYQWPGTLVSDIISILPKYGIKYIEIGNGTGLGTYRKDESYMADDEYIKCAINDKKDKNVKIGAFYIPSIGTKADLENFRKLGGDFVRIGVNATDTQNAYDSIKYAKSLGFYVFCNLMKTYAITKIQLVEYCEGLMNAGVDCIYIVDSAGGMIPSQVSEYIKAVKSFYDIPVGFHGHNNLSMANANSLAAIEAGAEFVDATLGGLGRGAGNAQLESLIAVLQKSGLYNDDIDVLSLSEFSKNLFLNLNRLSKGNSLRDIVVGMANFHDSYTNILEDIAQKYKVNPEKLLIEVSKINVVDPSKELFESVAQKIADYNEYKFFAPKFYHKNK
jgi:4-hydroxy-2-oxovalerate aldolase